MATDAEFEGRTAVITGAAMGIGRACAEAFAARGANVVIADIAEAEGAELAGALGPRARFVRTDVASMADMEAMAATATEAFGGIDILVNNAARAIDGVVDETDEARFREVIETNLIGVWRGMKVSVPSMRARGGGAIVNMSSVQGIAGFRGWAGYAAAKGGVNALTWQTAIDLAPAGIRVNAVAPGTIMTPLNERIFATVDDPDELIDRWNRAHPIGRFGQPGEVAEAVVFLASPRAAFITGEVLRVDGGLVVRGE